MGGDKMELIFIDPWRRRWLKVEESGSEWLNSPPAYGRLVSSPNFLRRRVPSLHRRKKSDHDSGTLATRWRRRIHHSSRSQSSIPCHHVTGRIFSFEFGRRSRPERVRARPARFFSSIAFAGPAWRSRSAGAFGPAGGAVQEGRTKRRGGDGGRPRTF